jgi:uncharacterized protein (DUF58 family)
VTRRGAALLLAPLLLVGLGAAFAPLLALGLGLEGLGVVAIIVDYYRARSQLRATRSHDDVLAAGRANLIQLQVSIDGRPVDAVIRDEYPPVMAASATLLHARLPATLQYTLTPPARGTWQFGATVVRLAGPWRLAERQTRIATGAEVRVDPDLSAVRAYEALSRRGQLAELGVRAIRRPGEGTEFERVRDAVPDDPLRSINWRATARTGRLMATELIPERAQPVIICLDHGRLMGVGAGALTKLDHAITAALLLVHVALRSGDRAGLLSFDDHVTSLVRPRAGRGQLRVVLDAIAPLQAGETEADYGAALGHLSTWQRRRALLAIFTDVLDPDQGAELVRQCARLRRRHLPLVVTVRDPGLDDVSRQPPVDPAATYARAVAGRLLREREDTLRVLRRSGVETIDADARTLSPRLVNRYLELKRRAVL